jgi:hypothetical protein
MILGVRKGEGDEIKGALAKCVKRGGGQNTGRGPGLPWLGNRRVFMKFVREQVVVVYFRVLQKWRLTSATFYSTPLCHRAQSLQSLSFDVSVLMKNSFGYHSQIRKPIHRQTKCIKKSRPRFKSYQRKVIKAHRDKIHQDPVQTFL